MSCVKQSGDAASGPPGPDLAFNAFDAMQPRLPEPTPADARNGRRVKQAAVPPQGVYLPNDNVLTPQMRSPEYVQMSNAAAITLGIMPGKMHRCGCTRCLNLLLTYPKAAAPTARTAAWRGTARPSATTPTAISSASTGRPCRCGRWWTSSRATASAARSTACASR